MQDDSIVTGKTDWRTKESRAERTREERRQERAQQLESLVPSRVCPCCGDVKTRSRQWVIMEYSQLRVLFATDELNALYGLGVVCRSCYWRRVNGG